jgi:DNA-binding response OmpR family regulator
MTHSILVVEDDPDIADLIRVNLNELGIETTLKNNGRQGLVCAQNNHFDLLLLDVMLPEMSGLDICREIRMQKPEQAILMLTAKNSETDRVLGLELGADDYMTKPFSVRELQARVRSHLRRIEVFRQGALNAVDATIRVGQLEINPTHHTVNLNHKPLDLTSTEFDLLHHLAKHPNQVFSRTMLLERVWGYQHSGYEHTVNSHINRLRAKVEESATSPKIIETVWGVGYKLNPDGLLHGTTQ